MSRTKRREKIAGIFEPAVETVPAISVVAKRYRTGIYVRLSVEDGGLGKESESFYNQERLLLDYVAGMPDLEVVKIYRDNGETGTNFNRPGFDMMMNDLRKGIIDCIVVKDLSRFGRNYIETGEYIEKIFPIVKVGLRMLSPISKSVFKVEMPNKSAMSDIEKMYLKLVELQELLKNRAVTSIRIVTTPEKMVVEETKRNYMYMNLYNFNVDGLYINRILPEDINNDFFKQWLAIQREYVACLKETFSVLPIFEIPWYEEELRGVENVRRIVEDVLTDKAVFEEKIVTERECFKQIETGYQLDVFLPCTDKSNIDLYQGNTDIVIKIGNFKRNIPLPNILRNYTVTGAKFEEEVLRIVFEKGSAGYDE